MICDECGRSFEPSSNYETEESTCQDCLDELDDWDCDEDELKGDEMKVAKFKVFAKVLGVTLIDFVVAVQAKDYDKLRALFRLFARPQGVDILIQQVGDEFEIPE